MNQKKLKQINGPIFDEYWGMPFDPDIDLKISHPDNPNDDYRVRRWDEFIDGMDPDEPGPPWDPNYIPNYAFDLKDGKFNNYWRQFEIDRNTLTDAQVAEKYPNLTTQYIIDDDIVEYKEKMVYALEQGCIYFQVGGYHPTGDIIDGTPITELPGSDLLVNHPLHTIKKYWVTLRSDQAPQGKNAPDQDFTTTDPHVWAWCGDTNDWLSINIRRIQHMWDTHFYKWNAEQHWLIGKLSKYQAKLTYKKDPTLPSRPATLSVNDPNLVTVNVTIPEDLEQNKVPFENRWDPDAEVAFLDIDNNCKLVLPLAALYNLDIEDSHQKLPDPREDDQHPEHEQWKLEQQ
jgi:hypothetical protein